ncbi:hypothetical protein ACP70R_029655 [Stipagrostis hirtigluma subsp. patula]
MGNRVALPAYEPGLRAGKPQLGVFPRLRGRRFNAAVYVAAWAAAGLLSATVPGGAANLDHVMLYFVFLMAAVILVLFSVAAAEVPAAERAAGRVEGMLVGAML